MEKSPLEKSLDYVPNYPKEVDTLALEDGQRFMDFPEVYKMLRTVENAYVQLKEAGHSVDDSLNERKYQIALFLKTVVHLALDELDSDLEAYGDETKEGNKNNTCGDLTAHYNDIVHAVPKLLNYLQELYPNSCKVDPNYKLFPEP